MPGTTSESGAKLLVGRLAKEERAKKNTETAETRRIFCLLKPKEYLVKKGEPTRIDKG